MVKVKVCGITRLDDALLAAELGAWAIGFIFYPKSPRYITPEDAFNIAKVMKDRGVKTVGVFVNESPQIVNHVANVVKLDYVQMHGVEPNEECLKLQLPYIKNIRNVEEPQLYTGAIAFLVDASDSKNWGGTGKLADWDFAKMIKAQNKQLMLSGGISIDNIDKALKDVAPDIVDVSSSLEVAPGVKDHKIMSEFFKKIRNLEIEIND